VRGPRGAVAREYGGASDNRSFGGASFRTFYARGQTGSTSFGSLSGRFLRQNGLGKVQMFPQTEMQDLVVNRRQARGIVHAAIS